MTRHLRMVAFLAWIAAMGAAVASDAKAAAVALASGGLLGVLCAPLVLSGDIAERERAGRPPRGLTEPTGRG